MSYYVLDANTGEPIEIKSANLADGSQFPYVAQAHVAAAIDGRAIRKWIVDKIPGSGQVVLGDADITYNLEEDSEVLICGVFATLGTFSDNCVFEIGSCDQINGSGTFTPLAEPLKITTGVEALGLDKTIIDLLPPVVARYAGGARSVTFRVQANDDDCKITCGFAGWKCTACP